MRYLIIILLLITLPVDGMCGVKSEGWHPWDASYILGAFYLQRHFRALGLSYGSSVFAVNACAAYKELVCDELYSKYPDKFPSWWHYWGDYRGGDIRDIALAAFGGAILTLPLEYICSKRETRHLSDTFLAFGGLSIKSKTIRLNLVYSF